MFDLPTVTSEDRKEYTRFRKSLIKDGFMMMQESVYSKLALNQLAAKVYVDHVKKFKPKSGIVQVLLVTEKQFESIVMVVGDKKGDIVDSSERMVVL